MSKTKKQLLLAGVALLMGMTVMAARRGAAKKAARVETPQVVEGAGNLSKLHREELIGKITAIRDFLQKSADTNAVRLLQFVGQLEKEVRTKKYGLVFEEHKERVDIELENNLPVLTEDKKRFIDNGGELNFLIEGDNLAALKLLEKTHKGEIDLIYIDPPYNTGNKDFVYDDSYVDANDTFRHSKWLSFMRARLQIAQKVLADSGVIFISLNDIEQPACRMLCDDIFGHANFCGQFIWHKKSGGGQTDDFFVTEHEYVLVYRKSPKFVWRDELIETDSAFDRSDEKGYYKAVKLEKWGSSAHKQDRLTMWFPVKNPDGKNMFPVAPDGEDGRWRVGKKRMERLQKNDLIIWRKDKDKRTGKDRWIPYEKIYGEKTSIKKIKERSILFDIEETGDASKMLTEIFGKKDMFQNPKPVELIEIFLEHCDSNIVLDFFAGSGTTGHAVMKLNAEDGGKRKFILVTNNENGICEKVTYERLKRVIKKEDYKARLKYLKVDYVPITQKVYEEYADDLLKHVRELVELENGLDFDHDRSVAITVTKDEFGDFVSDERRLKGCKAVYVGHDVLVGAKAKQALLEHDIDLRVIPEYYYGED